MRLYAKILIVGILACTLQGCAGLNLSQKPDLASSCQGEKYQYGEDLLLKVEDAHWKDRIMMNPEGLSQAQQEKFEDRFSKSAQNSYLVFSVAIENTGNQPLRWPPSNAPVFHLLDENDARYTPIGPSGGNMQAITQKVMSGSHSGAANINPNSSLEGTAVFDVPKTGNYRLTVSEGRPTGGGSVYAGSELMKCKVALRSQQQVAQQAPPASSSERAAPKAEAPQSEERPGDGGDDVEWVQKTLNNLGHACGPEDGVMGPNTRSCIRSFQKANDLEVTGRVNEVTYQKMLEKR